ncbi:MAG: hypothetical protein M0P35_00570 [Bacteroidales bacterium]|nr:hypothetical protein [Bacteroidales bacterium]
MLHTKGKQYSDQLATQDRLYNFKEIAKSLNTTPHQVLLTLFNKHYIVIKDWFIHNNIKESEFEERLFDCINYLIFAFMLYKDRSINEYIAKIVDANEPQVPETYRYDEQTRSLTKITTPPETIVKEAKLYIAAKERADLMSHKAMETAEIENNELHCIQWEVEISNITNYKVADIPDFLNYLINIEMIHSWKLFTDKSYVMVYIDNNRTVKKYNLIFTSHQLENINSRFYCSKMRTDVGNEIDCIFKWLKISLQEFIEFRK